MAYRTLLAHLPSERAAAAVVPAASLLAERHGAHLIGVHVIPPVELYGPEVPLPEPVAEEYYATRREIERAVREAFDAGCANGDFVAEWRAMEGVTTSVAHSIVELGDATDLLVLARDRDDMVHGADHERLIALSARPVLLLPPDAAGSIDTLGRRVLLAWDGSREATAAMFGALPLLVQADEVRLHRVRVPSEGRRRGADVGEDLAAHLARHGAKVEYASSDARAGEIGGELLAFAADFGADLMVMGCYGHSRMREFLLGGTTRHVLAKTTIPLLLHG